MRRCLAKDPDERLRDLGDAALELAEAEDEPVMTTDAAVASAPAGLPAWLAGVGAVGALALGVALGSLLLRGDTGNPTRQPAQAPLVAGVVTLPDEAKIAYGAAPIGYDSPMLTISSDGRGLVYVGRDGDGSRLYRHDLATFAPPEPIPGTEGALAAYFSPDAPAVAFVTNDKLARVDVSGDRLQVLGDVRSATRLIWAEDGGIYVGDAQGELLKRFPETGGEPEFIGTIAIHGLSDILPDGKAALFHERPRGLRCDFGIVKLFDFASKTSRVVLENAFDATVLGERIFFFRVPRCSRPRSTRRPAR